MSNLMAMLYTGASGIFAAQAKIDVTGHNIANIDNTSYSKQRVNVSSASVSRSQYGTFGRGVKVEEVIRIYDDLLARAVRNETSNLSYWTGSQTVMKNVKLYFNEMDSGSGTGLGEYLKQYNDAWHALANTATDKTDDGGIRRTALAETASMLAQKIQETHQMFVRTQDEINERLSIYVDDINIMAENLASINLQIARIEATGENANDLRDHRDAILDAMSQIVGINVVERPTGMIAVYIGGQAIVDDGDAFKLEARSNPDNNGQTDIYWTTGQWYDQGTNITTRVNSGTMQGEIKMRDEVLPSYMKELDELARKLIEETNKLHVSGRGLTLFSQITSTNNVENPEWPLASHVGYMPYNIQRGSFQIVLNDEKGEIIDTINIDIDPNVDTLHGIAEKIRTAGGNLTIGQVDAFVDESGALRIRTEPGYTFNFGPDTSNFLVAAGFNNFFSGTGASDIAVDKHILDNPNYISCADHTGGVGNNKIAQKILDLKNTRLGSGFTVDEFYGYLSGKVATDMSQINTMVVSRTTVYNEYYTKMQNTRGVSLEEEQINMVMFQRVLEANSRYINAVDEMLNLIVNNLGLVGR